MTTPYDSRGMDPENPAFREEPNEERNDAPAGTSSRGAGSSPFGVRTSPLGEGPGAGSRSGPGPGSGSGAGSASGAGSGSGSEPGSAFDFGAGGDELALRRLMRDAVADLKPAPDALDHLRYAVPARRTRRRQAMAGAAAAVLLACTAVPALLHAANTSDQHDTTAADVAHPNEPRQDTGGVGESSQDATGGPADTGTGENRTPSPSATPSPTRTPPSVPGATVAPKPSGSTGRTTPTCDRSQLGSGAGKTDAPDSQGTVYGWFRVANVSAKGCLVKGGGALTVLAQGSADASKILVLEHTTGDPAAGLPDVAAAPLVLQPGDTYEVRFAWVPDPAGPNGCPVPPTPTPTPTTGGGSTSGSGANNGTSASDDTPAAADEPPTPAPASVEVSHTPEAGSPAVADTTIPDACAGTIYKTAPLAPQ